MVLADRVDQEAQVARAEVVAEAPADTSLIPLPRNLQNKVVPSQVLPSPLAVEVAVAELPVVPGALVLMPGALVSPADH